MSPSSACIQFLERIGMVSAVPNILLQDAFTTGLSDKGRLNKKLKLDTIQRRTQYRMRDSAKRHESYYVLFANNRKPSLIEGKSQNQVEFSKSGSTWMFRNLCKLDGIHKGPFRTGFRSIDNIEEGTSDALSQPVNIV
jgi:hypothetical protein